MIKKIAIIVIVLINLFLLELLSFTILNFLPNLTYDQSRIEQEFDEYIAKRDSILGWNIIVDDFGNSRHLINRKNVTNTLFQIDFYGDSFTYGEGVNNDSLIWSNLISEKTNTIVNNRGVGGYGTDQAFLKYINSRSEGNIVVLNHLSENIIRNVNQFRHLIYPGKSFDLKPVFISENDSLKLIEIPDIHNENFKNFQENPNEFLKHDFFKIGSQSGIYNKRFPFSFTLFKSFLSNWKITSQLNYFSGYQPFYDKNHSSGALEITKLIIEEFNTDVIKNNSKPIITIIPTYRDFEYFEKYGIFPYQTLIEELNDKIELIDFGMEFLSEINSLDMDILLDLYIEPAGHMNEKGHYLLSKVFVKYLIINNYL